MRSIHSTGNATNVEKSATHMSIAPSAIRHTPQIIQMDAVILADQIAMAGRCAMHAATRTTLMETAINAARSAISTGNARSALPYAANLNSQ